MDAQGPEMMPEGTKVTLKETEGGKYFKVGEGDNAEIWFESVLGRVMRVHGEQGVEVHADQQVSDSHLRFFEDPKRKMRRAAAITARFDQLVQERVDPGFDPGIMRVSDAEFMEMRKDPEFQTLGAYAHKLILKSGKKVRPILRGEVGIWRSKICILEAGFHEVTSIQVPKKVGGDNE